VPDRLNRFEKFLNRVCDWLGWVSSAGLILMMLTIVVDVIGAKLFTAPLLGAMDSISILGLVIASFGVPYTQMHRGHIEIEFFTEKLPKRAQPIVSGFVVLLGAVLFALATWQMFDFALTTLVKARVSGAVKIPFYPFTFAASFCFFLVFLLLLIEFLRIAAGRARK